MIRYLYIPKDKNLDDFIDYAINNKFNQIIHGQSEILDKFIIDYSEVKEIEIPEYRVVNNETLVFKESETFNINLVDEFSNNENYNITSIEIYRVDDEDIYKKDFIFSKDMNKIDNYFYTVNCELQKYGEYEFIINTDSNDEKNKIIYVDKIIIYREFEEVGDSDDRFFFD